MIKKELFNRVGGFRRGFEGAQDHDLLLRITENTPYIYHIPKILYHWRMIESSTAASFEAKPVAWEAGRKAVNSAIKRRKIQGQVELGQYNGTYHVRRTLTSNPLVTIIVSDHENASNLLHCIDTIFEKSTYARFEIICIIKNRSEFKEKLNDRSKYSNDIRLINCSADRVSSMDYRRAVNNANGRCLLFMDSRLMIVSSNWIESMLEQVQRSEVGAVGGKVCLSDGSIIHAGEVIGIGGTVQSSHQFFNKDDVGYYAQTHLIRNVSAVSEKLMMVRRDNWEKAGGFDIDELRYYYQGIDLCLQLRQKGYINIFTPFCEGMIDQSRNEYLKNKKDYLVKAAKAAFKTKWKNLIQQGDPYYNPNFLSQCADFSIKIT